LLFCGFILYIIIKKIINLNKPFDESRFLEQYANQKKLQKHLNLETVKKNLPNIASYYIGI
jgi:quinol monooxygenase YgiN